MKLFNKLIVCIFYCLSILVFLLSIASYLGTRFRWLEITANFKLQYLLISFCLLFFWLLTRHYSWLVVSLLCSCLNLYFIVPWYFEIEQPVIDTNYESLRVIAFNVLHQNQRYSDVTRFVKNRRADIAIFLEATPPWDTELLALKKQFPYHFSAKKVQMEIYSKFPLQKTEIELYGTYRGFVISRVTLNKVNFTLIAAHAYPQVYFGLEGWRTRNRQIAAIKNISDKTKQPIILAGDLNVTMWSPQYEIAIAESRLRNARQGFGILPTQSSYMPQIPWLSIPLDHFLVSQDIIVTNTETGKDLGSDHLPILLDALIPSQKD